MNQYISQFDKDCRDFARYLDSISPMCWRSGTYDHRKGCVKRLPIAVQLRIVHDKILRYDNRCALSKCVMFQKHSRYVKRLKFILGSCNYLNFTYSNGLFFSFPNAPTVFKFDSVLFNTLKKILL